MIKQKPFTPLYIKRVVANECSMPKKEGERYELAFELSGDAPPPWGKFFVEACDTLYQPRKIRVYGNRLLLNGTMIEEFKKYQVELIENAFKEANWYYAHHLKTEYDKYASVEFNKLREQSHSDHIEREAASIAFDKPDE